MNLPQGQTDSQNWREHIDQAKKYSGTMVAYCREHNVDYDKFMYHRGRFIISQKAVPGGFAKVQPSFTPAAMPAQGALPVAAPTAKPKSYPQLPDPKWLAELIHNLIRDK